MASILEELELEQPTLVTSQRLAQLVERHGLQTPTRVVATRLRDRGWLLPTGRQGVWEFAPAAVAGAHSRNDPAMPLKAFLAQRPTSRCGLTFQSAAWAHGIANRVPSRIEVAAVSARLASQLPAGVAASVFDPHLDYQTRRGVPVLAVESVFVHMVARPGKIRSWESALEWLPELAAELAWSSSLETELEGRPVATRVRAGYLLQGLRRDLSDKIRDSTPPHGKIWFGARGPLRRHDSVWQVADTLLPVDPKKLANAE